jgi:hypothetical protein
MRRKMRSFDDGVRRRLDRRIEAAALELEKGRRLDRGSAVSLLQSTFLVIVATRRMMTRGWTHVQYRQ